jgi:hypothetical protein
MAPDTLPIRERNREREREREERERERTTLKVQTLAGTDDDRWFLFVNGRWPNPKCSK